MFTLFKNGTTHQTSSWNPIKHRANRAKIRLQPIPLESEVMSLSLSLRNCSNVNKQHSHSFQATSLSLSLMYDCTLRKHHILTLLYIRSVWRFKILSLQIISQIILQVDPSIIGGLIVNIGDKYVDMSIATKVRTYSKLISDPIWSQKRSGVLIHKLSAVSIPRYEHVFFQSQISPVLTQGNFINNRTTEANICKTKWNKVIEVMYEIPVLDS